MKRRKKEREGCFFSPRDGGEEMTFRMAINRRRQRGSGGRVKSHPDNSHTPKSVTWPGKGMDVFSCGQLV